MAGDYIKCPRCELNYIHKSQGYCDVCKAELKMGPQLIFAVDDDDDDVALELCSICKQNYIKDNEEMCEQCRKDLEFKKDDIDLDKDEEWRNYLDDDVTEPEEDSEEMLSLSQLAEEEGDALFDDEEEEEDIDYQDPEPDDFDIPEIDESDFEEEDEDEEEDENDDDSF